MSFAAKLAKKTSTPIHFIRGKDDAGLDCYWFIMCSGSKYDELTKSFGQLNVNLVDYGPVIESGYGKTPSEEVKAKLINEYGVNWEDYNFTD